MYSARLHKALYRARLWVTKRNGASNRHDQALFRESRRFLHLIHLASRRNASKLMRPRIELTLSRGLSTSDASSSTETNETGKAPRQFGKRAKKKDTGESNDTDAKKESEKEEERDTGEEGEAEGESRRVFKNKGSSSKLYQILSWGTILAVLGGLGFGAYVLRQPELMMPAVLNNLHRQHMDKIATALYWFLSLRGSSLEWREAMAEANGVVKIINYINAKESTIDQQRAGMYLLSLLAEYESTRKHLRHTAVFKTAAHYLKSEDLEVKGASLNVLVFMFQDKPSASLVVDSGVLKLMCEIGAKAFQKEEKEEKADVFDDGMEVNKPRQPPPEVMAGELALQALGKIPHYYPGGIKKLMATGLDEMQLNCIFASVQSDMLQSERTGNYENALACARICVQMNPSNPQFYQYCARIQSLQGNIDGAIWNMRRAVKLGMKESRHRMFFVQLLVESGRQENIKEARRVVSKLVGEEIRMESKIKKIDSPKASAAKPKKVKKFTSDNFLEEDVGDVTFSGLDEDELKNYNTKTPNIANLMSLPPGASMASTMQYDPLFQQLVKTDLMLQDYSAAEGHIADWLQRCPESPLALYSKAKVLSHRQQYKKALEVIDVALEKAPKRAEANYIKAYLLHKVGSNEDAMTYCQAAVKLLRRDTTRATKVPNLHLLMGKLHELKGDFKAAEASYGHLIKCDRHRPMPHYRRGRVLEKLGKLEEADHEYATVLQLWSDACLPQRSCQSYFGRNEAAAMALRSIANRRGQLPYEKIGKEDAKVVNEVKEEKAPETVKKSEEDELLEAIKVVTLTGKDLCRLYDRLHSAA